MRRRYARRTAGSAGRSGGSWYSNARARPRGIAHRVRSAGGAAAPPLPRPRYQPVKSRWLFAVLDERTTPVVRFAQSAERTVAGDAPGFPCRYSAATPAVCGVAIDVPLIVFVAVLLVYQADVIESPGANQSTQLP